MERNNSNRDFEQYVKQNADQYRMFPSEKVWKGVHNALHRRRRWYGFGLAFLFLMTGGAVTWVMHTYPVTAKTATKIPDNLQIAATDPATETPRITDIAEVLPFAPANSSDPDSDAIAMISGQQTSAPTATAQPGTLAFTDNADKIPSRVPVFNTTLLVNEADGDPASIIVRSTASEFTPVVTENKVTRISADADQLIQQTSAARLSQIPSIEDVVVSYNRPKKRINWQVFITPTISYRRLSVDKSISDDERVAVPFATLRNVNSVVTHKPDLGVQLGVNARYPVSKTINLRAGFQFNINRYDIQAYSYGGEAATIDLAGGPGQTVTTWTNLRNRGGYKQNWLKNYYLSVSLPLGAEVRVFGNKKTYVGVAGTIQPTYVVSDRAYLISTDYKNYAKVPWLIRNVNLSTGFEAFVNYGRGKTRWQVGPQVRYQLLSSFQKPYPVKENLFDFGVKIGVSVVK